MSADSIQTRIQHSQPRNRELLAILAETEYAVPAHEQLERHHKEVCNKLWDLRQNIRELEKRRVKELKDHESYRDSFMKRLAFKVSGKGDEFEAKAKKEEQEYFDVLQELHKAKEEAKALDNMRNANDKRRVELQLAELRNRQARTDLDELYDIVFQGQNPAFPEEDSLESKAKVALQLYHETCTELETDNKVHELLHSAHVRIGTAITATIAAERYASILNVNIIGLSDEELYRNQQVRTAELDVGGAMGAYFQARALSSLVPDLVSPEFRSEIIIDDWEFKKELEAAHQRLEDFAHDVAIQYVTARDRMEACKKKEEDVKAQLSEARLELQKARERIFEHLAVGDDNPTALVSDGSAPPDYQEVEFSRSVTTTAANVGNATTDDKKLADHV